MTKTNNVEIPQNLKVDPKVEAILKEAKSMAFASKIEELEALSLGPEGKSTFDVEYTLPNGDVVKEAEVCKIRNGISANYTEAYMRRRDPDCMYVADNQPSDKARFADKFDFSFDELEKDTFSWLKDQDLAVFGFQMGPDNLEYDALAICPINAGFFAFGLGLLQGIQDVASLDRDFTPKMVIYIAPPFRQTHFDGKQVVVHNRGEVRGNVHEIFSYNLYPGPSAKKGVYGALIELGEQEDWVTAHCSAVQAITPYDNVVNFMHEGASGGGKSEMLQQPHRASDGRLLMGQNIITNEKRFLEIPRTCDLHPVCDDMGLCHPDLQEGDNKLYVTDAEDSWFVRVDHITEYGTDPELEHMTIHPERPLLFLNIDASVNDTALIWNHIEDEPGKVCPNPRVIVPRDLVKDTVSNKVPIDFRSFGIRTPPCTKENPSYGILGLVHFLPPALAWLWRMVSPRGYANPSIVSSEGMSSEGVGSYWPFSTGKRVTQANLLLEQIKRATNTTYTLIPNQHIGAWKTGFMPQWLVRDYLARRGHAPFQEGQLIESRSPLVGYGLNKMRIEGVSIPKWLLQIENQPEVGIEAYDAGAKELHNFFVQELKKYQTPGLSAEAAKIIEACLDNASIADYENLMKF